MVEWFSSRRDSPIVARHEVLGSDAERQPRPGGTVEVVVSPEWREENGAKIRNAWDVLRVG
jgi:hypothetical protein